MTANVTLAVEFLRRDLRNRFAGSFSGGLWALMQPLLQLAITSFVFVHVFKARVPGSGSVGFVPFLAIALWPWVAVSEAVLRSTTAIQDNAALIGKVALPRMVLVVSAVGASFLIHVAGFIAIVLVLALSGQGVHLSGLLPALLLYVPLLALALGFGLLFSALQVFVRDLVQVLAQVLPLMMFCAPVYYDRALLPERFQTWLDLNPYTFYAEAFRALLLDHGTFELRPLLIALAISALVLLIGVRVFRKLDPHFEDFL